MPIQMIDATGKVLDSKAIEKMYKEIECKITEVFETYNLTLGQVIDVLEYVRGRYINKLEACEFKYYISLLRADE